MFMLIIWLQGIWLPLHGYSFARTPLWAGIYMLPLTAGFLHRRARSRGYLSDHFGSRPFATGGMLAAALSFLPARDCCRSTSPTWPSGLLLLMNGLAMGAFAAPNRAGVMNSLPPQHRGVGGGMNSTFQNAAQVLSIGIFFTLMIVGLAVDPARRPLPRPGGPRRAPAAAAHRACAPAAGLHALRRLPRLQPDPAPRRAPAALAHLLGGAARAWSPGGASSPRSSPAPFEDGLHAAFDFAIVACLVAAGASWLRGGKYVYTEPGEAGPAAGDAAAVGAAATDGAAASADGADGTSAGAGVDVAGTADA